MRLGPDLGGGGQGLGRDPVGLLQAVDPQAHDPVVVADEQDIARAARRRPSGSSRMRRRSSTERTSPRTLVTPRSSGRAPGTGVQLANGSTATRSQSGRP